MQPVIPLHPPAVWCCNKTNKSTVKIDVRSIANDPDSTTIAKYFIKFDMGTPEEFCLWRRDLNDLCNNNNITTGAAWASMVRHLLDGDSLKAFNDALTTNPTVNKVKQALLAAAATVFPRNAVRSQLRYIRHEAKKPSKMDARRTLSRLRTVIGYLKYFPSDGTKRTNVFSDTSAIMNELKDNYYRLLPNPWKAKMNAAEGFDLDDRSLDDIVNFAEQVEIQEGILESKKKSNENKNGHYKGQLNRGAARSSFSGDSVSNARNTGGRQSKDCLIHGVGCGHDSHQCKVLRDQASKMRGQYLAKFKDTSKSVHKKNQYKPWEKKDKKQYSCSEVENLLQRSYKSGKANAEKPHHHQMHTLLELEEEQTAEMNAEISNLLQNP